MSMANTYTLLLPHTYLTWLALRHPMDTPGKKTENGVNSIFMPTAALTHLTWPCHL
jgi:hypothetical protein